MKKVFYYIFVFLLAFTSCKKDGSNPVTSETVPSPPTLATPKDTSSNIEVPGILTWNEIIGTKTYTLQVSSNSSFSSFIFNKSDITTTSQQIPDLNYSSVYYWRVKASNSAGTSDWSKVWSFTTTSDEPAIIPQLTQPIKGAVDQKLSPVLIWEIVSNANCYALQISTNSSFTSFVFDTDSLLTNSTQLKILSGETKYYWRVRAKNSFGTKGWSETWTFTTGVAPLPPILLAPNNEAANQLFSLILGWNASDGATSYNLQLATDNLFSDSSLIINANVGNNISKQLYNLNESKTYYWKVATVNSFGTSDWSSVWKFTTGLRLATPLLSSPANAATDQPLSPTLNWSSSTGATSYTLQVSLSSSFTNNIFNQSNLTSTSQQLTGLTYLTSYYWRVSSASIYGTSGWSNTYFFTTIGKASSAPTLSSPADGETNLLLTPTLTWNASNGATSYNLQVATDNSFSVSSLIINENVGNNLRKQLSGLSNSKTYYWKVASVNKYGTSDWSTLWSFTTGALPEIVILNSPADGAIEQPISPVLSWNGRATATNYSLQVSLNSSFTNYVYSQSNLINTTIQITGLEYSTYYYWRVCAKNNFGSSAYSSIRGFKTIGTTPKPPTLNSPAFRAVDQTTSPTLGWNASATATSYSLQVSTNSSFTNNVFNQSNLTGITQQITGLSNSINYYWRVNANNSYGTSVWSDAWNFMTVAPTCPGVPSVTYEGKTYHTVQIGKQCWLKENLDVGKMINSSTTSDSMRNNGIIEKYCYKNNLADCDTNGGLYQWDEAMQYSRTPGTKGICPVGWHIPTQTEFLGLIFAVNHDGNALKAVGEGSGNGIGSNTSGFSALLGEGFRYGYEGNFYSTGGTIFWSSTFSEIEHYHLSISSVSSDLATSGIGSNKGHGFRIRCIKD
ncbi:MAG: FISUMP domain-containing protein [Ignavibacteria bacterium]|nr:FISUMP domain-containing protein [Ignavibacteria bacterium]